MPYIVVVKHQTKGTSLIPTKIKDAQKAIDQAKIENQEPGYDWQHATVGYMPDTGTVRKQGRARPGMGTRRRGSDFDYGFMADPHFETLLTDCPGQFWKADVVNVLRAPKLCGRRFEMNAIAASVSVAYKSVAWRVPR